MVHIIVFLIIIVWSSRNSSYCKNLSTIFFIKFSCALQSLPTNVIVQTYLFVVSQYIPKHLRPNLRPAGFFSPFSFFFYPCFQFRNPLNRSLRVKKKTISPSTAHLGAVHSVSSTLKTCSTSNSSAKSSNSSKFLGKLILSINACTFIFSSSCALPCYFIVCMDILQVQVDKPTDFAYIRCNNVNWL